MTISPEAEFGFFGGHRVAHGFDKKTHGVCFLVLEPCTPDLKQKEGSQVKTGSRSTKRPFDNN